MIRCLVQGAHLSRYANNCAKCAPEHYQKSAIAYTRCCVQCYYLIFYSFDIISRLAILCPILAPIMAAIIDKLIPINIMIQKDVVQNDSSNMAGSRFNLLQRIGTYQTLLGSFKQIKNKLLRLIFPR